MNGWLQWFLVVGTVLVVAEVADGFRIEFPIAAWIFATISALALAWTAWARFGGRIGGPIVFGLLALSEFVGVAFTFDRPVDGFERAIYASFAFLSATSILLAVATIATGLSAKERGRLAGRAPA